MRGERIIAVCLGIALSQAAANRDWLFVALAVVLVLWIVLDPDPLATKR